MSGTPGHFCPGCGMPRKPFLRYPWHLCNDCRKQAVDGAGRALEFSNESASGGFMFRYAGDDEDDDDGGWIPCRGVIAYVAKRPVHITEARFGGIVAEPMMDRRLYELDRVHDLRRGEKVARPAAKPGPFGRGRPFPEG